MSFISTASTAQRASEKELLQLSRLEGTVLDDDPWFIYGCQVYALQNLQAQQYRALIAVAYERQGYDVQTVEREPTSTERQRCETQKEMTSAANEAAAGRVADAEEPSDDQSPETRNLALEKRRICERFDVDPAGLTAAHVLDERRAFASLRNRFLYVNETALGLFTHGRLEQLGEAYVLDRARIANVHLMLHWLRELTTKACAADLLSSQDWFGANDDWVKRLHRLVMEDSRSKRYPGSRHTTFSCPISAVQAILRLFGLRTETKQKRVGGAVVRLHRITDPLHHFNPSRVLNRWEANPQLVLGELEEASSDVGVTDYL